MCWRSFRFENNMNIYCLNWSLNSKYWIPKWRECTSFSNVCIYTTICWQKLVFLAKVSFGLYWVYCKPYEKFKFWHTYDLLSLFIPYTVYPLLSYKRLCTDIIILTSSQFLTILPQQQVRLNTSHVRLHRLVISLFKIYI